MQQTLRSLYLRRTNTNLGRFIDMNLLEIFHYEYKKHKTLIWCYIGLCVFCAVVGGPFITQLIGGLSKAVEVPELGTVGTDETIFALATVFSRSEILKIAGGYSNIVGVAADPITAIVFIGLMENINNVLGHPLNIMATPAGNPWVLLAASLCFMVSKLMKSNGTTKVFGLCTLDELEKYIGLVFILMIGVMNVTGLTKVAVAAAASGVDAIAPGAGTGTVLLTTASVIISVVMSLISIVVYFVIKTVIKGLDTLQACFSFIPYSGLVCEILKTVFVVVIILINIVFPWLGWILNTIVFIICCFLFRTCFNITLFLHRVYIRPFFRGLKGFSKTYPLVSSKLPKRIRKYYEAMDIKLSLAIPVYVQKKYTIDTMKLKKLQRVWLVKTDEGTFLVKKKAGKKKVSLFELTKPVEEIAEYTEEQDILHRKASENYHIRKGIRYIEIFKYLDNDKNLNKKNPKKSISIIMSREYSERYDDILEITGFINYNEIVEEKKAFKRKRRKEKVEAIKEKVVDTKDLIAEKVVDTKDAITEKIKPKAIEATDNNKIGDNEDGNN